MFISISEQILVSNEPRIDDRPVSLKVFCDFTTIWGQIEPHRVKLGNFGHQVNSDIHLQTLEIQLRRLLMSRLIRIFTVCLVNLFFIVIFEI